MSSIGEDPAASPQLYFCHQCNHSVTITPSPSPTADLTCPTCHGGFLEELENPTLNPNPTFNPFDPGFPLFTGGVHSPHPLDEIASLFGGIGQGHGHGHGHGHGQAVTIGTTNTNPRFTESDAFNPFLFLQNYLQTIRASGANVQFVIENNSPGDGSMGGGFRLPTNLNLGDYFIGPGLEQLIQQLAENDPNRYGTPPASKSAVEGLPTINISKEMMDSDSSQCAVCKDSFELGEKAKQMPCKHIYHNDCIIPWLELHNSCPVCRYELPTDDTDYELRETGNVTQNVGGGGVTNTAPAGGDGNDRSRENNETPTTTDRRFRVSLPWPFRSLSSAAETSNSGTGNNEEHSNSANQGSGPRQEDLD